MYNVDCIVYNVCCHEFTNIYLQIYAIVPVMEIVTSSVPIFIGMYREVFYRYQLFSI